MTAVDGALEQEAIAPLILGGLTLASVLGARNKTSLDRLGRNRVTS